MKEFPIDTINTYFPNLKVDSRPVSSDELPLFYKSHYSISKLIINKNSFLAVVVKNNKKNLGPRDFKKHLSVLEEKFKLSVIWCLDDLPFLKTQRLIENGFNFIVRNKIVYLPILNSVIKIEKNFVKNKNTKIKSLGINILIMQMLKENLEGLNKVELAKKFNVTPMTIGRAIETLVSNNLCYEEKISVQKIVKFPDKNELWDFFKIRIENPVQEIIYLKKVGNNFPLSGISALAKNSLLSDDEVLTLVISKKMLKTFSNLERTTEDEAKFILEVWNREPILTEEGTINVLDAFLVLKNEQDERVLIAVEKWLNKNGFEL
jgi:hypothetical protein